MASPLVVLLHLLLVSLVSASHNFGGLFIQRYKGRNSDGTFRVETRTKDTFDGCGHSHYWYCYSGSCGGQNTIRTGEIDKSSNSPLYTREWCETETVSMRTLSSDKPFIMRAGSCCWIRTRNFVSSWILMTSIDLGVRSDTNKPNKAPEIAVLPFIRVPYNCPRRYELMAFDPDGDQVRCRYGTLRNLECSRCDRPSGFILDENSCTLNYQYSWSDSRVYAFEMVVEDFPQRNITLHYSDRSQTSKIPLIVRRNKRYAWWGWQPQTTMAPTTTTPNWWSWWRQQQFTTAYTTAPQTTTIEQTSTRSTTSEQTSTRSTTSGQTSMMSTTSGQTATRSTTSGQTSMMSTTSGQTATRSTTSGQTSMMSPTPTNVINLHATPLSKLPLQFSFLVDSPVPSCREGEYLPKLVDPTPKNKAQIKAGVNEEIQIKVKGEAIYSSIHDLLMTGPLGIKSFMTSGNEFVIKWTPTINELDEFHPICFAIESTYWSSKYHSEMRCVLVKVVQKRAKTTVLCSDTTMTVTVEKSTFSQLDANHLRLNNAANTACRLTSNSTHIIGVIPLNACGTQIKEDRDNLYFHNEITTVDNMKDVVTRKHLLEVQFFCQYAKRQNMTLAFSIHRDNITVEEKGFGTFTYGFEFYTNSQFHTMKSPSSYPLEYDIGSRIFMAIEATTTVNNTELFVESCSATPYDIPNYSLTYPIIENGCNVDPTVITHNRSHPREFKFSMEAFKFIGQHNQVYITCQVMMCSAGDPTTRCSRGCINSTQRAPRWKREAPSQSGSHFISQGPLRLRASAESGPSPGLNLNLVFIAGCVLAALAMISAVVVYKAKASGLRYQPLPTQESDTAH